MSDAVQCRYASQVNGLMFLDAQTVGRLAKEKEDGLSSALLGAMADEIRTMRWALATILRTVETRVPERGEAVLKEFRQALRNAPRTIAEPMGATACSDIADYLFTVLEPAAQTLVKPHDGRLTP